MILPGAYLGGGGVGGMRHPPPHFFDKPSVKIKMVGKMVIISNNYMLVGKIAVIFISFDKDALVGSKSEMIFISFNKNTLVDKRETIITSFEKYTWSVKLKYIHSVSAQFLRSIK